MDNQNQMEGILEAVANGSMAVSEAMGLLKARSFEDLGYAKVDFDRAARQGSQEVIYGAGKTPEQIVGIVRTMQARGCRNVLITRLDREAAQQIAAQVPMAYYEIARIGVAMPAEHASVGSIAIVTGGTSDLPVAEEAAITAELLGNRVTRVYDVGVAGLHRLLQNLEPLQSARVIVAVAGMRWALFVLSREPGLVKISDSRLCWGSKWRKYSRSSE